MKPHSIGRRVLCALACATALLWAVAQADARNDRTPAAYRTAAHDSVRIHFGQSRVDLDLDLMGNREALEAVAARLSEMECPDSLFTLQSVEVVGAASPEGRLAVNERLSRQRADRIFSWLEARVQIPDSMARFTFLGRDWSGLLLLAEADEQLPYRDETLAVLREIAGKKSVNGETEQDGWLPKVKRLRGGVPYRYMYAKMFPRLRQSHVVLNYTRPEPVLSAGMQKETAAVAELAPDTIHVVVMDTVKVIMCP